MTYPGRDGIITRQNNLPLDLKASGTTSSQHENKAEKGRLFAEILGFLALLLVGGIWIICMALLGETNTPPPAGRKGGTHVHTNTDIARR